MPEPAADPSSFSAFAGRRVFMTGHTGFKGSWLSLWLAELGARVTGYALDPPTMPSNFERAGVAEALAADVRGDIRDRAAIEAALRDATPDVVLHLAAQSVVLDGYADPAETFSVNVMGTAILLDAIRAIGRPCAVVIVSSDKCYQNDGSGHAFSETDPLGGHDPYSASKAGTELVAAAYRSSFFDPTDLARHGIAVATARAGNVIGGGDWTPAGVLADVVRAIDAGEPIRLRYPDAIRPWQHVLEPLGGYLTLAARLQAPNPEPACSAWNFGPRRDDEATVRELVGALHARWGTGSIVEAREPGDLPEAGVLRLSIDKAQAGLGWTPRWRLTQAVQRTVDWYRSTGSGTTARAACLDDIDAYMTAGG
jgi:CDP-glucose 4,6-dehydratase